MGNQVAGPCAGVMGWGCAPDWGCLSVLSVNSTIKQGWKRTYRKSPGQEKSIKEHSLLPLYCVRALGVKLLCPILKAQFLCAVSFSSCSPQIPLQKLLFSATLTQDPEKLQQLDLFQPRLFTSVYSEKNGDGTETEQDTNNKYTLPEGLSVWWEFFWRFGWFWTI